MAEDLRNILIGALTMVAFLIVTVFSFSSGPANTSGGIFLAAQFNDIDGLDAGTEVRMGGIKIGEVMGVGLREDYSAEAIIRIEAKILIPTDTSVAIHTDGIFGGKFVTLEPGAEEEFMKTGDTFEVTQDSVNVQDLLTLIIGQAKSNQIKVRKQLEELQRLRSELRG